MEEHEPEKTEDLCLGTDLKTKISTHVEIEC